jgi:hypothetical protein
MGIVLARITSIVIVLTPLLLAPLRAQSLADLAREEAERRKDTPESTRVITNKDLPGGGATRAASPAKPAAIPQTSTDTKSDATAATASGTKGKDDEPVKDQKYWAGRQKDLNEQLARDQVYSEALQSRINALTSDFVNRDDPAQRSVIANDRQRSIDELERLKATIANDKKAIEDFQDEARRASVPPGWLR